MTRTRLLAALGVAAFFVAFAWLWWASSHEHSPRPLLSDPDRFIAPITADRSSDPGGSVIEAPEGPSIQGTVRVAGSDEAIAGALIYLTSKSGFPGHTIGARAQSSERGSFRVTRPESLDGVCVVAIAAGFGPGVTELDGEGIDLASVTVYLRTGLVVSGRVQSTDGAPVPGVTVVAADARSGAIVGRDGVLHGAVGDLEHASVCVTDPTGRFVVGGLRRMPTAIRAWKHGFAPRAGNRGVDLTLSADTDLQAPIVLDPVRGAWITLRDSETHAPLCALGAVSVQAKDAAGAQLTNWYPEDGPDLWTGVRPNLPGDFRAAFRPPRGGWGSEARINISVVIPGYEPIVVQSSLGPVSDWPRSKASPITVARREGATFGTMILRIVNYEADVARPENLLLSLRTLDAPKGSSGAAYYVGQRIGQDDRWEVESVLAGRYTLGGGYLASEVEIRAGAVAEVLASRPDVDGGTLSFDLVDSSGDRLHRASFSVAPATTPHALIVSNSSAFLDGSQRVSQLPPGEYSIVIAKPGFRQFEDVVEIAARGNVHRRIVLEQDGE